MIPSEDHSSLLHPVTTNFQQLAGGDGGRLEEEQKGAQPPKEEDEEGDPGTPPGWLGGPFIRQPQTGSDVTL